MQDFSLFQVDAFTNRLFAGNPAAVVLMSQYPDDALLRDIAAENNLAETAFLVQHDGQYRLRYFTPTVEVPLCGHATLASAAVVMERLEPQRTEVVFQSASGPLTVRRNGAGYVMNLPIRRPVVVVPPPKLAAALGATLIQTYDDGFNYIALLQDAGTVRELMPDISAIARLDCAGVIVTAPGDAPYDFVSRYFAPAKGIPEDPVTGGAHCALTPLWSERLNKTEFLAFQASHRGGELVCRLAGDRVELEGGCVFYLEGRIVTPQAVQEGSC